ncbi:MAG: TlpA disulfide reductase family protein [Bacteroidota bacterium]
MKKTLLIIIVLFISSNSIKSQVDTMAFAKISIKKPCYQKNAFLEYMNWELQGGLSKSVTRTKIWFVKDKKTDQFLKMRAETVAFAKDSAKTLAIFDGKQSLHMNKIRKSCFLFTFSNKTGEDETERIKQLKLDYLPSFMISDNNKSSAVKEFYNWIKSKEVSLSFLPDTILNGMKCFGAKIVDTTCHINDFNIDMTPGEEIYTLRREEITYFNKTDSVMVYRRTNMVYPDGYATSSTVEEILSYSFNKKDNMDDRLYLIKTDTLKDYFLTFQKLINSKIISEVRNIPFVKAPNITGISYQGESFELYNVKAKLILLDFWAKFCGSCLLQMEEFKKYHKELEQRGLSSFGINSTDTLSDKMLQFLKARNYAHPLIYSKAAGNIYRVVVLPLYFLLDEKFNIIESFYKLDESKINEIKKRLEEISK